MTESQDSTNSGYRWLSGAVVAILIIAVLLLAFFFSRISDNAHPPVAVTPISGGAAVPASLSESTDSDGADAEAEAKPQPLPVGRKVTNISPEGAGTRLYNDAGINALVMESYQDGTAFVVVEPNGDHDEYPVQIDEMNWYRVRTSDGLVGWVMAEQLVPIE